MQGIERLLELVQMPRRANRDTAPDFLAVEEAAMVLRIGRSCACDQAREFMATEGASGLPVVRIGRLLRVPRAALEQMAGGPISWPIDDETASIAPRRPTRGTAGSAGRWVGNAFGKLVVGC